MYDVVYFVVKTLSLHDSYLSTSPMIYSFNMFSSSCIFFFFFFNDTATTEIYTLSLHDALPILPRVDALDRRHPARVVQHAGELRHPWTDAVRGPFGDPEPDFRLARHRVLPAIRLLQADAENAGDRLAPVQRAEFLGAPSLGPGRHDAAQGLVVGKLNRRQLAGGLEIRREFGDESRFGIDGAQGGVPPRPRVGQARRAPLEKGAPRGVAGIGPTRQIAARRGGEIVAAVHAVTVASLRRPPVREDAVHAVHRDDFAMHLVHEVEVVGPQRAGDPEVAVRPVAARRAVGADRDPVGVGGPDVLADRVGIGARDDLHAERAAPCHERAERIGLSQPRAAVVQRHFGRVIRDDAARAQRGGVGVQAPEIVEPEPGIELPGVVLDQRQLHPAHRPVEPAVRGRGWGGGPIPDWGDGPGRGQSQRAERAGARRNL